jgi:hypothetical protein
MKFESSQPLKSGRYRRKFKWVLQKGRVCQKCGYGLCPQALVFHHVNKAQKEFALTGGGQKIGNFARSSAGQTKEAIDRELAKTLLLCSRCHTELECGYWSIEELIAERLGLREQLSLS